MSVLLFEQTCSESRLPPSVSPPVTGWRLLTCRALPDLIVAAATRPNPSPSLRTRPTRLAPSRTLAQPAVSPRPLVGSYPTGSPLTSTGMALAGMLSVAVVVRPRLSPACPHLRFRGATLPVRGRAGSREVPLDSLPPSGGPPSSDGSPTDPRDIIPRERTGIKYRAADSAAIPVAQEGLAEQ